MLKALSKAIAYVVGAGAAASATLFCVSGVIESLEEAGERSRDASAEPSKQAAAN